MRPEERRRKVITLVREHKRVSVEFLSEILNISRETIRRDLNELADQGDVVKYHGGASLPDHGDESVFAARLLENTAQKKAIARRCAQLFNPGDSLFIDTGTTTLFLAEELAARSELRIITNSLTIAQLLGANGRNEVFLIGGQYKAEAAENLGPLALEQIRRFNPRHAVITIGAMGRDGIRDFSIEEAEVARTMIAQAASLTVLADLSKLGRAAMFPICPLSQVHRLVTEKLPAGEFQSAVRAAGTALIEVEPAA